FVVGVGLRFRASSSPVWSHRFVLPGGSSELLTMALLSIMAANGHLDKASGRFQALNWTDKPNACSCWVPYHWVQCLLLLNAAAQFSCSSHHRHLIISSPPPS